MWFGSIRPMAPAKAAPASAAGVWAAATAEYAAYRYPGKTAEAWADRNPRRRTADTAARQEQRPGESFASSFSLPGARNGLHLCKKHAPVTIYDKIVDVFMKVDIQDSVADIEPRLFARKIPHWRSDVK